MTKRSLASALGLAAIFVLLPATLAPAEFRGTDMWSTLAPGGPGGLVGQYPLSYYTLDYHVDGPSLGFGGVDAGDIPALVAQFLAAFFFMLATFFMRVTISAFDWAFNVNVISGRHGLIGPVGDATQQLYYSTFVPLMGTAIVLFGGWLAYKTVSRRFSEAGAGLVRVVCLSVIALAIILNPGPTIGQAMSLSNSLASAIASGTTGANGAGDISDRIFDTFVFKPWVVLEFGGLERCVSAKTDSDGFPADASPDESVKRVCHNAVTRYAPRFLAEEPGSEDRKKVYEQIRDGDEPFVKSDAPAVDMMQAGGSLQRLVFAVLLGLGIVAAILLLGLVCFASLFAQLGLMVLVAVTPAMLIAALFPGLHGIFWSWLKWIGKLLVAKVIYALILSAALGVSAALTAAGGVIGYLPAFALQTALFGGLVWKRKALSEMMTSRREYQRSESNTKSFVAGAATAAIGAVSAPVAAAAAVKGKMSGRQQAAPKPDSARHESPEALATTGSGPIGTAARTPDSSSPPASAGREGSWARDDPTPREKTSEPSVSMPSSTQERGDDPVPTRKFSEDYEQARAERAEPAPPKPVEQAPVVVSHLNGATTGSKAVSLRQHLEAERAKQETAKTPE